MKAATATLLLGGIIASPRRVGADCLVGDVMYGEGDSTGYVGWECVDANSFDATVSSCGPDGEVVDAEAQLACDETVPYCVQCGPRGRGNALCLSTPDAVDRDCEVVDGGDDDEDFLPRSTPSPAGTTAPGAFDQCDNEQDIDAWEETGGEAGRADHMNYCAREYQGAAAAAGVAGCLVDSTCIETCFQETYGYTAACSVCFGVVPSCTIATNCLGPCFADPESADCTKCNAPCVEQMNECTGLPLVGYCLDGRDGADDPSCTLALREEACEGKGLSEEECADLGCCAWDAGSGSCNAACLVPEDGDACCAAAAQGQQEGSEPLVTLTGAPVASPAAGEPTGGGASRTAAPNYVETAAPNYDETAEPTPKMPSDANQTISAPAPPGNTTNVSPPASDGPTRSPTKSTGAASSPTDEPTAQPTYETAIETPEPTSPPTASPTTSPTAAVVVAPGPDNSRVVGAGPGRAASVAASIAMGLAAAVLA